MIDILHKTHGSGGGGEIASFNPANGEELGRVRLQSAEDYDRIAADSARLFERWRMLPAPKRGEMVREIGDALREAKDELGGW